MKRKLTLLTQIDARLPDDTDSDIGTIEPVKRKPGRPLGSKSKKLSPEQLKALFEDNEENENEKQNQN
jgi:hypothetical protein